VLESISLFSVYFIVLGFVIFPPYQNGYTKGAVRKTVLDDCLWNSCHAQELVYQRLLPPLFKMNNALEFLYH